MYAYNEHINSKSHSIYRVGIRHVRRLCIPYISQIHKMI